jgi:hypothetical protein
MSDSVLSVRVGFVVDGVVLGYVFLQASRFSRHYISPMPHTDIRLCAIDPV